MERPASIMSVDVEDWFQVENLKSAIPRESWNDREYRVEANTELLLDIFAETDTRATFFCLGWVAERSPALIRRIQSAGHEIASHGYGHYLIYDQTPEAFREDVVRAKDILEGITGTEVLGYRAPSFSITPWALDILAETGHRYDSSHFPVSGHDRYGALTAEDGTAAADSGVTDNVSGAGGSVTSGESVSGAAGIAEIPIATLTVGRRELPWGGGGYFRLIPSPLFAAGFRKAIERGTGQIFYLHPWEVDPGQPRVENIRRSYRFRHYVNLHRTASRLRRLCETVQFDRADRMLSLTA